MTGAMYAAVAGLKTHMSDLNVIGNNVANVNTYGYKTQRSVFSDSIYTMYSSGSNGTTTIGGINPSQVGYGSTLSSIDTNMGTGTYAVTGYGLDSMIMGDGFYLVGDKTIASLIDASDSESLKSLTLTRVGNFEFKADGYLADSSGNCVYGYMCIGTVEGEPVFSDQLVPIRYPKMQVITDADGNQTIEVTYPTFTENGVLTEATAEDGSALDFISVDSVSIDANTGLITAITKDTNEVITIGCIAIGNVTNPNGVTHQDGPYYKCADGAGNMSISLLGGVSNDMYIGDAASEFGEDATLEDFTLGLDYTNASLLEDPANVDDGCAILNSGTTTLKTGGLEASNVDLSTEITRMITTQRGYQANTRIITVTDSMLEELVNMKR